MYLGADRGSNVRMLIQSQSIWRLGIADLTRFRSCFIVQSKVTFTAVPESHTTRIRALEEYERAQKSSQIQEFEAVKLSLSPHLYDENAKRNRRI